MGEVVTTSTRAAVVLLLLSVLAAQAQRKQAAPVAPTSTPGASTPGASTPEVTASPVPWSPEASKLTLEMIGNSHVDAVWLWPFAEADAVVHSTFRSALDRLREDPKLTMTTSSSQFYEWIEGSDPGMLDEIRQRVKQGRWDPVGGWWVEPDVNIPSGESLIRQGLYGQTTLQRLFGRMATTGYNPDSFGHTGSLPQILKLQRMNAYVFMRPNQTENPSITQNLFQWQGIDGTEVLTYRIPLAYDDPGDVHSHMHRQVKMLEEQPETTFMEFFGIGDHGGGPTKENLRTIAEIQKEAGAPKVVFSTPDRYFEGVRHQLPPEIQVVQGDLQHHSVGAYTAGSNLKKLNRSAETALQTAEKFNAIGSAAWGAEYPKSEFTTAWKRVLLMQFHDSMAGTALPSQFVAARDAFGRAMDTATEFQNRALLRLTWQIPTVDPESQYLVVFNPHSWPVRTHVDYDLQWRPQDGAEVIDESGRPIAFQWTDATTAVNNRLGLVAEVDIPPMGYRQIRIRKSKAPPASLAGELMADSTHMENEHLRVAVGQEGIELFDKDAGHAVFAEGLAGMRAVVLEDASDTWSHGVRAYTDVVGKFVQQGTKLVENGPLRARLRQRSTFGSSTLTVDWLLYRDGRSLEANVSLDWHEHQKMLKLLFPVAVQHAQSTYEIAYGAIHREENGDENPGQRWIDLTGTVDGKTFGFAVINDAKYGYSVDGNTMEVSAVRSPVYANHDPHKIERNKDYQWMDQGVQTFRMELLPHGSDWQAEVVRAAEQLSVAVPVLYQGIHKGSHPQTASFLSVDQNDIVVEAIKMAEEGTDVIVRSYETAGHATRATLDLQFAGVHWTGDYHPYEIKTLRVDPRLHRVREVDSLEE